MISQRISLCVLLSIGLGACSGAQSVRESAEPPSTEAAGSATAPADGDLRMQLRFVAAEPDDADATGRVVLEYVDSRGPQSRDANVRAAGCTHDAMLECSWDPAIVRLRISCLSNGIGAEAEVASDGTGACALRSREIDADHASRGVVPEWTIVAAVPCPPPGQPCPHQ